MRRHDQLGQRQRMRGAAHILLHDPHSAGRLDVKPAAVEGNALADDRDARMARVAPFEFDQTRRMFARRRPADGVDQRIAAFERIAAGDGDFGLVRLGNAPGLGLQARSARDRPQAG